MQVIVTLYVTCNRSVERKFYFFTAPRENHFLSAS